MYLKIRRRDGVESLATLEEGEFKVPIDGCIKGGRMGHSVKVSVWCVALLINTRFRFFKF